VNCQFVMVNYRMILEVVVPMGHVLHQMFVIVLSIGMVPIVKFQNVMVSQAIRPRYVMVWEHVCHPISVLVKLDGLARRVNLPLPPEYLVLVWSLPIQTPVVEMVLVLDKINVFVDRKHLVGIASTFSIIGNKDKVYGAIFKIGWLRPNTCQLLQNGFQHGRMSFIVMLTIPRFRSIPIG
jgi:hypothetical protein